MNVLSLKRIKRNLQRQIAVKSAKASLIMIRFETTVISQVSSGSQPTIPIILNFRSRHKRYLFLIFHNFCDYDSHLVCESIGRFVNTHQIKVIAETFEKYKFMKVRQLKYIDNQQFMNNSLANLTKNLGGNHPIMS
jgi:hypothetical protein